MLLHTAVYAGVPAANSAVAIANKTLSEGDERAHFVQSLERGLSVIKAFGPEEPELTLVRGRPNAPSLTRAAARRFLLTLQALGYVRIGRQAVRAHAADARARLRVPLQPLAAGDRRAAPRAPGRGGPRVQQRLRAGRRRDRLRRPRPDEPHHARVDQRRHPLPRATRPRWAACCSPHYPSPSCDAYLDRAELRAAHRRGRSPTPAALPPSSTAIRTQGWALVDQELEEGLRSVAAPGPRSRRRRRRRRQRLRAREPGLPRGASARRCCRRCWPPRERIEADLRDVGTPQARAYH